MGTNLFFILKSRDTIWEEDWEVHCVHGVSLLCTARGEHLFVQKLKLENYNFKFLYRPNLLVSIFSQI